MQKIVDIMDSAITRLNDVREKLHNHNHNLMGINIIFDGAPSHESGRFVEVETDDGSGIRIGEWIERDDGFWSLRITAGDIIGHEKV